MTTATSTTTATVITTITVMAEPVAAPVLQGSSAAARVRLMTFLSPAFPVGAFSYSHGLEWAIDTKVVGNAAVLAGWIEDLLSRGSLWSDAVIFRCAHEAASRRDDAQVLAIAELAKSLAPSRERHLETMAMGEAFLAAVRAAWPEDALNRLFVATCGRVAYPVAVGAVAAIHAIPLEDALPVYLNALAANLVSVAVRLVPLGQSEGLRVIAKMEPVVLAISERAARATIDDVGSTTIRSDIASMKHETQYSRVFRT
jgi:urease accessory protein